MEAHACATYRRIMSSRPPWETQKIPGYTDSCLKKKEEEKKDEEMEKDEEEGTTAPRRSASKDRYF